MPAGDRHAYDVEIGGTGFMLADVDNPAVQQGTLDQHRPGETKANVDYPAVRQTGAAGQGYRDWPVEKETPLVIDDLSGGFGHHVHEDATTWYGFADTRMPGKWVLPPQLNAVATTSVGRMYDHFERTVSGTDYLFTAWGRRLTYHTDPTSLTTSLDLGADTRIARSADTFQGVHHVPLTYVAVETTSGMSRPYQMYDGTALGSTAWSEDTQKTNIALSGVLHDDNGTFAEDVVAPFPLTLNSLQSTQDAVYARDLQVFEGLKVDVNNTNGNSATITASYWNGSAWTSLSATDGTASGGAALAQDGSVTWSIPDDWQPNSVNAGTGYHVKLTWSANLDSSVSITDIDAIQRDTAMFFAQHKDKLYSVKRRATGFDLYSSDNGGLDATWARIGTITDLSVPVTGMYSTGDRLIITTAGMPRVLAGDGETIGDGLWPHPRSMTDALNGIGASVWRSSLWVPARFGLYRMFETSEGVFQIDDDVGPNRLLDNDSPVRGRITAFTGDDYYGYAFVEAPNGTSYLISYVIQTGKWHSILNLGSGQCLHAFISPIGNSDNNPHLYFHQGVNLKYLVLPRTSPDPTTDSNCRFDTATTDVGEIFLGRWFSQFMFENKVWLTGKAVADDLDSGQTVKYESRTVDTGSYTTLDTWSSGVVNEANFATNVATRYIEHKITLATDDASKTPVLRAIWLSYAVVLPRKPEFRYMITIKPHQINRLGQPRRETASQLVTKLDAALDSSVAVTVKDPDVGTSVDCLPQPQESNRLKLRRGDAVEEPEYLYYAVFTQHQATIFGTWARMGDGTWASHASRTWDETTTL